MVKIAVILSSTRSGRAGEAVAHWVLAQATARGDADYELIDLADYALPEIDEAIPPAVGRYTEEHTKVWAGVVARFDGYVIVTPEYNHSFPGKLKNALDRVWAQWNDKVVGFVSYGVDGGIRAVEALRPVSASLRMADVGPAVALSSREDWSGFGGPFTPRAHQEQSLAGTLDAVVAWTNALHAMRTKVTIVA
ncbi:NADPH-dependent FMN reductase [Arthrobacter cryoconiti]|uniref:NADPH-dependent FMN reductase n=1 Tax=Arthrobacter cryoconiti TaxID=748907 RepID=A0ABV8R1Q2_9MICC|nr:NAD(P)H-dependent oxidoreductase [Arthrobacter cryoconiti]MCC9067768.1 NAD(P)H-dependent oxidoreductase [Arthrobacter cryoconiti]